MVFTGQLQQTKQPKTMTEQQRRTNHESYKKYSIFISIAQQGKLSPKADITSG